MIVFSLISRKKNYPSNIDTSTRLMSMIYDHKQSRLWLSEISTCPAYSPIFDRFVFVVDMTYTYRHVVEKLFSVNFNKRIHARFCLIVTNNNVFVFFAKWNDARFVHIEQYWRLLRTGSIALHVFAQCRCNTKSSTLYRE